MCRQRLCFISSFFLVPFIQLIHSDAMVDDTIYEIPFYHFICHYEVSLWTVLPGK